MRLLRDKTRFSLDMANMFCVGLQHFIWAVCQSNYLQVSRMKRVNEATNLKMSAGNIWPMPYQFVEIILFPDKTRYQKQ